MNYHYNIYDTEYHDCEWRKDPFAGMQLQVQLTPAQARLVELFTCNAVSNLTRSKVAFDLGMHIVTQTGESAWDDFNELIAQDNLYAPDKFEFVVYVSPGQPTEYALEIYAGLEWIATCTLTPNK